MLAALVKFIFFVFHLMLIIILSFDILCISNIGALISLILHCKHLGKVDWAGLERRTL